MVSCSFHSPPGVLFTFPSRYCFTIGHSGIFSLTRWSSQIHTGFHVPHATRDTTRCIAFPIQDYHFLWLSIPTHSCKLFQFFYVVPLPLLKFRLFPLRSPLLRESFLLSFPLDTKMFQFSRFTHLCLYIQHNVLEFPHSEIYGS